MAKMWASASSDRRTEPSLDAPKVERPEDTTPNADRDILELAQRFERAYSNLGPLEPEGEAAPDADLFPEITDVFEEPPVPARPAAAESARVVQMPRREPESMAAPASPMREPEPNVVDALGLDEAMAILRASEQRGTTAPNPVVDDPPNPRAGVAPTARVRPLPAAPENKDSVPPPTPGADWATQVRTGRPVALAVAAVALVVGIGGGYLLASGPKAKTGLIESSPQGTHLRLELTLPQP